MLLMTIVALPLLVSVAVCAELVWLICRLGKARLEGSRSATAVAPLPTRLMKCGEPAPLSSIMMEPKRGPGCVGAKVTVNVHVLAAGTPGLQVSVSEKSPVVVMLVIVSGALPMLRSSDVLGWLTDPTGRIEN